jgi:hypothetical protein
MYKQRGMSLGGLIVVLIFLVFFVYVAFRIVPAYIDYWQIEHIMEDSLTQTDTEPLTTHEVRTRFAKELSLNNIRSVTTNDLIIEPTEQGYRLSVEYSVKQPFWRQIHLCMDFKAELQSE